MKYWSGLCTLPSLIIALYKSRCNSFYKNKILNIFIKSIDIVKIYGIIYTKKRQGGLQDES